MRRMGSKIIKTILEQEDMNVVAAIESPNTPFEGKDVGEVIGIGEIGVEVNGAQNLQTFLKIRNQMFLLTLPLQMLLLKPLRHLQKME